MFYDALSPGHGLPHRPTNALVVPRPVGWISTISLDGVTNLAPYSFFNLVNGDPPQVMLSSERRAGGERKDTQRNIEETGEFVFNLCTWDLREAMNLSASIEAPSFDELKAAGLTPAPSRLVRPPRVAEAPIHLECRLQQVVALQHTRRGHDILIGDVVGVHIDDAYITDGLVDTAKMRVLARLGYNDYAVIENVLSMPRLNATELAAMGIVQ